MASVHKYWFIKRKGKFKKSWLIRNLFIPSLFQNVRKGIDVKINIVKRYKTEDYHFNVNLMLSKRYLNIDL
ncbi:hypothetical protein BFP75_04800 [Maribacter sp. 4G9]|nr:hypothetical protein BFP75_04800 [Maribacter sp. 4G9]